MNQFEETLAYEVRRYEYLYNPSLKGHKDQQMVWNSWQEIGQTLDKPADLTVSQRQRKRKVGMQAGRVLFPLSIYSSSDPHIKHRPTTNNMPIASNESMVSTALFVIHVININYVVHNDTIITCYYLVAGTTTMILNTHSLYKLTTFRSYLIPKF